MTFSASARGAFPCLFVLVLYSGKFFHPAVKGKRGLFENKSAVQAERGRRLSPVDFAAMPDSHNHNDKAIRLYDVEDAVVPNSDAVKAFYAP